MKKRTLTFVLALLLLLTLPALPAAAVGETSGECGDNAKWALNGSTLTISGYGNMWDEYVPWYDHAEEITTVVVNSGITSLTNYAFADCVNLTSVTIAYGVTQIGKYAFGNCASLTGLMIPTSVLKFGEGVFYGCTALTSVAFPNYTAVIPDAALYDCENLTSVSIPSSIVTIGDSAFAGCAKLESVTLSERLEKIGTEAFFGCEALKQLTLPAKLKTVGDGAFACCTSLGSIQVIPANTQLSVLDNVLFNKDQTSLIAVPATKSGAYAVPNGVTEIRGEAFAGCEKLTEITFPTGVTSIGEAAFFGCTGLTRIALPEGVTRIPSYGFSGCVNLKEVALPASSQDVYGDAFTLCTSLEAITVPESCASLKSVDGVLFSKDGTKLLAYPRARVGAYTVPDGVVRISNSAFEGAFGLTALTLPDSLWTISHGAFRGCVLLSSVTFGSGLHTIDDGAFALCPLIETIVLPNDVGVIGGSAFLNCTSLKSITIGNRLNVVRSSAFVGCDSLTDVYYAGDADDWKKISIQEDNLPLLSAEIHYGKEHVHVLRLYPEAEATCTEDGNDMYYRCNTCGKYFADSECEQEISGPVTYPALGHDWGEWSVAREATEDVDGEEQRTCKRCGDVETRAIPKTLPDAPFTDVAADAYYNKPVRWAVKNGVTTGTSATTFGPDNPCTRAQVVTFLWRAMGCPEPKTTECKFTDVVEGQYYYKPVLWAVENGITNGMSETEFGTNATCTRGQIVTFLWRTMGQTKPTQTEIPFTDVAETAWYAQSVLWAVENGVTNGIDATHFGPDATCTRGQVVTFLFRAVKE